MSFINNYLQMKIKQPVFGLIQAVPRKRYKKQTA